jgi:amino acid transporter
MRLPHNGCLPLLHAKFRGPIRIFCSSAIRTTICIGFGQRRRRFHDLLGYSWVDHGGSLLNIETYEWNLDPQSPGQNTSIAVVAASRLIYAVARDGVLPLSGWIGQVTADGQPRNAVRVMYIFGALVLLVILPSNVAFTSLISAGGVPTIAAYGLISLLRLTLTPTAFKGSHYYLGKFGPPMYLIAAIFQALVFAVCSLIYIRYNSRLTHLPGGYLSLLLPSDGTNLQFREFIVISYYCLI